MNLSQKLSKPLDPRYFLLRHLRHQERVKRIMRHVAGRVLLCLVGQLMGVVLAAQAAERPNILWITSEDNSPYLGCYGDPLAQTPNLDRLAAEGVRYRHAFANAPVCSSARTTLITGMYASTLGVQHHRSRVAIPADFQLYPELLRAAGYYATNNSKSDYNLADAGQPWDESSPKAHYRNRKRGQPFFAVFNFTTSHESQVAPKPGKNSFRVPPEKVVLPPYHPDTPVIRRDWANYYDQMTRLDVQVGELLKELALEGLADETIVVYNSDHGGALPRGKRNIHDSGTRVPLIIRLPNKWAALAPAAPGEWVDQLVSFVDLPATFLSLCGASVPKNYQGKVFLGPRQDPPRQYVFLYRGRMDERYDTVRAVRDRQFRYIHNYSPQRSWGQHYAYPFEVLPSMRSWHAAFEAGKCNAVQARYWQEKPAEELYDVAADPFEIHNLAGDPRYADRLQNMRRTLRDEMIATRDTGFIPEGMFAPLAGERTIYDYAQSSAYPMERIIDLADKATSRDEAFLDDLAEGLDDQHPVMRYWAATGCLVLKGKSAPLARKLLAALDDSSLDVRVAAAEALGYHDQTEAALTALAGVLKQGSPYERLSALNSLDFMRQAGQVSLDRALELTSDLKLPGPADRIPKYFLSLK
jgi:arylsulfatase A-like enzyme